MSVTIERLDTALEPLTLPRGVNGQPPRTLPAMDFTPAMAKLAARVDEGDEAAAVELLRRCLPGITDEEIDNLLPSEVLWVFGYCARRLRELTELLGNVARASAVDPTSSPSALTTNTSTPSRASRARSGKTGSSKPRSRSTAPSSPSIG